VRRAVAGFIAVGSACVAACFFPDVGSLGGANDAATPDGSTVDATPDVADGSVPDAAPTSPCLDVHAFCDDFDHGTLGAKWDSVTAQAGPLDLSPNAVTPPNSLHTTLTPANDGNGSYLSEGFSQSSRFHTELDVMLTAPADTSKTAILVVGIELPQGSGVDFAAVDVQRYEDGGIFEEGVDLSDGGSDWQDIPISETFDTWKHVAVDIDWNTRKATLTIDGVIVQSANLHDQTPQGGVQLDVAVPYSENENGDWDVYEDNVVVDTP